MSTAAPDTHAIAYRPDIDGLRAVAVLAVVVFHFVPLLAPGGYVGVDVFFVVSGYLITAISLRRMQHGRFTFLDFYARRARRLLPALISVVLVCLLVGSQLYGPREQAALGLSAAAASLFAANIHFHGALDYFDPAIGTRPLVHLWSLGVEEQFYLLAPPALYALYRRPKRLWTAATVLVAVSFGASLWATWNIPRAAFFLPMFRAWELGLGALLAVRPTPDLSSKTRNTLGTAGLLAILFSFFALDDATPFPGLAALPPTLGTVALLVAGPKTLIGQGLSLAPMRAIGRWSYSWYLWHYPVLVFGTFWLLRPPNLLEAAVMGTVSLIIAAASTEWFESPIRRSGSGQPGASVRIGLLASCALAALGGSYWMANDPGDSVVSPARLTALMHAPEPDCDSFPTQGLQVLVCAIGNPEPPLDVVLLGDSYAAMEAATLRQMAMDRGLNGLIVTRNDCPPLIDIERADLPPSQSCDEHTDAVMAYLETAQPRHVVLHGRWPLYVERSRIGDPQKSVPQLVHAGSRSRDADLKTALHNTVTRMKALGAEVFLVGSLPEATYNVPVEQRRRAQLGLPPPPPLSAAAFEARRARSKAMLESVGSQTGAQVLQISDALCDDTDCVIEDNGTSLYYDDCHLSPHGSRFVSHIFTPIVD